jgi:hypothetical protein
MRFITLSIAGKKLEYRARLIEVVPACTGAYCHGRGYGYTTEITMRV